MIGRLSPTRKLFACHCGPGFRMVLAMACLFAASPVAWANHPWTQATLYRDAWGVPHAYAANPASLGYAVGWAQAEDRTETLLRAYRLANGRAAEVWGEAYAESDAHALKMGHSDLAMEAWAALDPITQALCEGFAAGANAWMSLNPDLLPPWAEPVRPIDPLALLHHYQMTFAPMDAPGVWRPSPATPTGNAWAVAPSRSRDGAALLVTNPHASYDSGFQWYELHVIVGDLNVLGGTLVGLPLPLVGHNERIAWGLTPNQPDIADVYEDSPPTAERPPANVIFEPARGLAPPPELLWQQWVMAHTRPFYVNMPGGMETRTVVSLRSNIGPLLGEAPNGRLWSYRVGGYGDFGGLRQFWEMGRARSLDAFRAALSMHQLAAFHIVYADADGNIFYRYNAKVGAKQDVGNPQAANFIEAITGGPAASSWRQPHDGADSRFQWGPIIPPEDLPTVINPASGWLQASGGPPWEATADLPWGAADLPRWLVNDRDSHRAGRVRQLLRNWDISFQDAQSMVFDVVAPAAIATVPALLEAAERHPSFVRELHPDLPAALEVLEGWNFAAEPHAAGMTFFHIWWQALSEMAGISDSLMLSRLALIRSEDRQRDLLTAASNAAQAMRNNFGAVDIPWGEVNRIRRGTRIEPMPGGIAGEPVFMAAPPALHGEDSVRYGFGYGLVVELGDMVRSVSLSPFGASDNPDSLHFDDQLDLLLQRRFKRSPFELDAVQREANSAFGSALFLRAPGLDGQLAVRTDRPVRARLVSFVEPPAPIPQGLAPFSLYAMPLIDAAEVRSRTTIEIRVPSGLCRDEHLDSLALYGFDGDQGWSRLQAQTLDPISRAFFAEDDGTRLVAVLGPAAVRLRVPDPDSVPRPGDPGPMDAPSGLESLILAEAPPVRREPTVGELGALTPLPETGSVGPLIPSRIARPTQPAPAPVPSPLAPAPEAPVGPEIPLAPVAPTGDDDEQPSLFSLLQSIQPEEAEVAPEAEEVPLAFETARGRIEFHAPPPESLRPIPPPRPADPSGTLEAGEGTLVTPGGGFISIGPGGAAAGTRSGEDDGESPPPAQATPAPRPQEGELRPLAISPVAHGSEMVVRAPGDSAFFQLNAPESFAARAAVLDGPPAPFPAGWVHFSEVVAIEFDPPDTAVAMTLTIQVPRGAVPPGDLQKLVLHGYTREHGWTPMQGQQVSVPARTFSSAGSGALAYAVLGDAGLRPAGGGR